MKRRAIFTLICMKVVLECCSSHCISIVRGAAELQDDSCAIKGRRCGTGWSLWESSCMDVRDVTPWSHTNRVMSSKADSVGQAAHNAILLCGKDNSCL